MARLEIRSLHKYFDGTEVIKGVDLTVEDREFCVFLGPSGCGKSTLLRLIAGLEDADEGSLVLDGQDITEWPAVKRNLAMVFQSYALYPHMTVRENMSFALKLAKADPAVIASKVAHAAKTLALEPLLERKPAQLSGGQRQRVAIGRAIVREPRIFLFDEPLSNLDAALRGQMRLEIARLHQELAATMIYVTHDQVEAMTLADKVVVFNEGRIEQIGSPLELYRRPVNRFVASFLGVPRMSFLDVTAPNGAPQLANGQALELLPEPAMPAGAFALGVRPEQLALCEPADHGKGVKLAGRLAVVERLGSDTCAYVQVAGLGTLTVRTHGEYAERAGADVCVRLDPSRCHVFNAKGVAVSHPMNPEVH
ncbi:ABC transporter ATP-binding protein [Pendulispora albinea]|uniref:ABC transporter ATP-binding protein n=1 Tax=Pendulispora albinea TaxID=2741071 RepID=A0ABZ2LVP1_9BACT